VTAVGELTGLGTLTRFVLRRDRVRTLVWVGAIVLTIVGSAASVKGLYPTQADLDEAAAASRDNAAAVAFNGPDQALDTLGGQVAFQVSSFGLILTALMAIFMVGRETRAEEEQGRLELVRSLPVGRHTSTAAALVVVTGMSVATGALIALGMLSLDLPVAGSLALGGGFAMVGLVFTGITLVAAQVTENTRVVYGAAGGVLGASFVLRAVGDIGDGTLSWLSPIGWAQKARPYAGESWWPLLLGVVAAGLLVAGAVALTSRRDVGAGLVASRPGPARGSVGLGRPLGLALRLQRGSVIAWSAGLLLGGVAYGSVAQDVDELVGDNEAVRDIIAASGAPSLTDSYLGTSILMLALVAGGFAISSVLRLRSEETALRAEPVLATRVSRPAWVLSHVAVAAVGSVVVMAAAGLGTGLSYGIAAGDAGQVPRLVGAGLAYVPALWLLAGVALLLFGVVPRAVSVAWAVLGACFLVGLFAELFDLPTWVRDLSPFEQIPELPAADLAVVPIAAVTAVALALVAAGVATFRHRDVG
jgi:ABC-2 type transport system permease protein